MAFMIPTAQYLTADEAAEYCYEPGDIPNEPIEAGWYSRLSAPGYMDCTEWQGPYPNAFRALRDVCRTYDVDAHGEVRED